MRALAFYVVLALAGFSLHAQSPIRAARTVSADVPRTTDGHPDLQGTWVNDTVTPLVRPQRLGTKEVFTEEEAAEYEKDVAGRVEYEFIIDNPTAFTRPWSAKMAFTKGDQPIYEYACHEGNYSMIGTLKGVRAAERVQPDR